MSTTSIIAITIVLCLFTITLIACAAILILTILRLHRHSQALITKLELLSSTISASLESSHARIETQVALISGQGIKEAVAQFLETVKAQSNTTRRIEQATIAFADIARHFVNEGYFPDSDLNRARASGLGPESYAPAASDSEPYLSRGTTAVGDDRAITEESADNSFRDNET